jgi:hypothetical protein
VLIPVLDRRHYVRQIPRPRNGGWNPTTHLARLHHPLGGELNAWIKVETDLSPVIGNEAIGWLLARGADIPSPEHAALLIESADWFAERLGTHWQDGTYFSTGGQVAAWCCADVGQGPIRSVAPFDEWNLLALLRTEAGAQIAAFDHWLANADRNTGNLLRLPQGRYAVIDHGLLFGFQDWRTRSLDPPGESHLWQQARTFLKGKKLTMKEFKALQSAMAEFGSRHPRIMHEQLMKLMVNVEQIADIDAAQNVLSFLSARSSPGWVAEQVGVLA